MTFHITAPIFDGDALCAEIGGDEFYPETGGAGKVMADAARELCRHCEVRNQCLQWALDNAEPWGIWGGLTEVERRQITHRRRAA